MGRRHGVGFPILGILLLTALAAASAEPPAACGTALLVIDVQTAYATDPEWHTTIDGVFIIDAVASLLELARSAGLPIIYVKDVSQRDSLDAEQLAFPDAIAPRDGDRVIEKKMQDAFAFTDLGEVLAAAGITRLLISGLASHACVDATAIGAVRRGFEVIVIANGHTGFMKGERAAEYNARWISRGIPVIASGEIDWSALCAPPVETPE